VRLPDAFAKEMEQATIFQSKNAYAQIEQKWGPVQRSGCGRAWLTHARAHAHAGTTSR
jgi:hypothetical protein